MKDTVAVIVAGGKGLRFGGNVRKQYLALHGKPLLWWSVMAFDRSPSVHALTVVVPEDDLARVRKTIAGWSVKRQVTVVAGGASRADSVRQGLQAIPKNSRYVAVHDAVRPLVQPETIERVIAAARRSKAALAAVPSKDTVKLAGAGAFIKSTPPRETVWLAQTPQVFERRLLWRAHGLGALPHRRPGPSATDDAMLVEKLGVRVKLVEAPSDNIKVTVPIDYVVASRILEERL